MTAVVFGLFVLVSILYLTGRAILRTPRHQPPTRDRIDHRAWLAHNWDNDGNFRPDPQDLLTIVRRAREGVALAHTGRRWGLNGTHYLPDVIDLDIMRVEYIPKPDRTNTAEQFWNH